MLFGRKEDIQQLNLKAPEPTQEAVEPQPSPSPTPDPAKLEAIRVRAKEILDAGRIPQWLFLCQVNGNFLMLNPGSPEGPVMLLFPSPHGAKDYLRAMRLEGTVGQFKTEGLRELTRDWIALPAYSCRRARDRGPVDQADFAAIGAHHHATRPVCGESHIRAAMDQFSARDLAGARSNLEYVRDHFECGIPYLHQMIGIIAGMQGDEGANAEAVERLREFGTPFDGSLEFSVELLGTAMTGLLMNFGMLRVNQNTAATGPGKHIKIH